MLPSELETKWPAQGSRGPQDQLRMVWVRTERRLLLGRGCLASPRADPTASSRVCELRAQATSAHSLVPITGCSCQVPSSTRKRI